MSFNLRIQSILRSLICKHLAVVLTGVLVLTGCDTVGVDDESEDEAPIERVAISPDSVSIEVGEQADFSIAALTASGDTVQNADLSVRWWSSDTTVFTVEEDGLATGRNAGEAFCKVEVIDEEAAGKTVSSSSIRRFVGRDSAFVHIF